MEQKKLHLKSLLYATMQAGYVSSQVEFAKFIGINPTTLSRALAGDPKYLTDKLLFRIERLLDMRGISITGDIIQQNGNNTAIGKQTTDVSSLVAEMAKQREMYQQHTDRLLSLIENLTKK